jgi:hypothetical protein
MENSVSHPCKRITPDQIDSLLESLHTLSERMSVEQIAFVADALHEIRRVRSDQVNTSHLTKIYREEFKFRN